MQDYFVRDAWNASRSTRSNIPMWQHDLKETEQAGLGEVAKQTRGGETVAAFCQRRQLCVPHFYWWKERLGKPTATKFIEVKFRRGCR